MVRILGNSPERIRIADLNDVIYFHQTKDYSDQEFESKDLQREIRKGNIAVLEKFKTARSSSEGGNGNGSVTIKQDSPSVSLQDIKQAVREVLPEMRGGESFKSLSDAVRDIIPMIVNTVRQEVSSVVGSRREERPTSTFMGPEYIPDISTSDMTSRIKADEKEVSGSGINDALSALKNMNPNNI